MKRIHFPFFRFFISPKKCNISYSFLDFLFLSNLSKLSVIIYYLFIFSLLFPISQTFADSKKQTIQPNPDDGITIIVEKGQTLSIISKTYLDDPRKWKELLKSNQIDNPNLIIPGMKLWIPKSLGKKPLADLQRFTGTTEVLKISQKQNDWAKAKNGEGLYAKDEVRTLKESEAQFVFLSGSRFEITENSHVIMERGKSETEPDEIFLRQGRIRSLIPKTSNPNQKMFLLKTESADSVVKGTDFLTEVDPNGNTTLSCYEGSVAVTAEKVTVLVNSGYATYVEKGKPPVKPFPVPDPPIPENK
ncbi:FecR domain-containing protein [Leptospira paudalimensis]|uniref:FecR domain-containing protein n=1 Tax=Leptospira paudalimensis TaxID=2950024 RepID=A0ABT3M6I3_9LEPT|nr:FecR domain-containing protein [Leptospira paudalimensis]MCW7503999.1 FecR domain-containing protein [Leptospira paudalimensis]